MSPEHSRTLDIAYHSGCWVFRSSENQFGESRRQIQNFPHWLISNKGIICHCIQHGAVKMATIVNSFARAGIYPINRSAVANSGPATLYSGSTTDSSSASSTHCASKPKSGSTSGASSSLEAIELQILFTILLKPSQLKNHKGSVKVKKLNLKFKQVQHFHSLSRANYKKV